MKILFCIWRNVRSLIPTTLLIPCRHPPLISQPVSRGSVTDFFFLTQTRTLSGFSLLHFWLLYGFSLNPISVKINFPFLTVLFSSTPPLSPRVITLSSFFFFLGRLLRPLWTSHPPPTPPPRPALPFYVEPIKSLRSSLFLQRIGVETDTLGTTTFNVHFVFTQV